MCVWGTYLPSKIDQLAPLATDFGFLDSRDKLRGGGTLDIEYSGAWFCAGPSMGCVMVALRRALAVNGRARGLLK